MDSKRKKMWKGKDGNASREAFEIFSLTVLKIENDS